MANAKIKKFKVYQGKWCLDQHRKKMQRMLSLVLCATICVSPIYAAGVASVPGGDLISGQLQNTKNTVTSGSLLLEKDTQEVASEGTIEEEVTAVKLDVENILQHPELPNGCEITSATIVLNYLGYEVDKMTMANEYLNRSATWKNANPEEEYMGNPAHRSDKGDTCGWYCMTPPIVEAVDEYIRAETDLVLGVDAEVPYHAVDLSGCTVEDLKTELQNGNPLIVWVTMGIPFQDPRYRNEGYVNEDGEFIQYFTGLHCVTLTGYTDESYIITDPINGVYEASKESFERIWGLMGSRAVVIQKTEPLEDIKTYFKSLN